MPYLTTEHEHDPIRMDEQMVVTSQGPGRCLPVRLSKNCPRGWPSMDHRKSSREYDAAADTKTLRQAFPSAQVKFSLVWATMHFEGEARRDICTGVS